MEAILSQPQCLITFQTVLSNLRTSYRNHLDPAAYHCISLYTANWWEETPLSLLSNPSCSLPNHIPIMSTLKWLDDHGQVQLMMQCHLSAMTHSYGQSRGHLDAERERHLDKPGKLGSVKWFHQVHISKMTSWRQKRCWFASLSLL